MPTEMTLSPQIMVSQEEALTTISLVNPGRKNAINAGMSGQLLKAMQAAITDEGCRVIILRGHGEDFCAGADLDPKAIQGGFDVTEFLRTTYNPLILAMRGTDKPIVAQVRGNAVGVGFNFALACDLIFADETARFSQIFTKIGLSSDGGGAYFLWEKLGYHKAYELLVTGKMLDAASAEKLGLINQVLPPEGLEEYVQRVAQQLANGPFVAIRHSKANLRAATTQGLPAALEQEAVSQGKNFRTKDFLEGVMAFLQKRKANWKGE
jgi:2-(1,2-epoxy-1,2-dihydrophenyl)acetyl-CoA isomerase